MAAKVSVVAASRRKKKQPFGRLLAREQKMRYRLLMIEFLRIWAYIHSAPEHGITRWLMRLTAVAMGCSIAVTMHMLHLPGF